jgi:DNA-binding MarR family transcriptional regulator
MSDDGFRLLNIQNQVIIALLARMSFTEDNILEYVISKKRDPERYISGYNALDGSKGLSEIAKVIGVTPQTLSPILKDWEAKGIIYEVENRGGIFYRHLLRIGHSTAASGGEHS